MLKIGSVVTVIEEDHWLKGLQGEVANIRKRKDAKLPIGVRFAEHYEIRIARSPFKPRDGIIYFLREILREDEEFTPENRAKALFRKDSFLRIRFFKDAVNTKEPCMHRDCEELRTKRIMVNTWGTVDEVDVCDKHADDYHGKCVDGFPYRE
ncbi:MAG: hypothetical protein WC022_03355 [Parcubacteria group bacterium]